VICRTFFTTITSFELTAPSARYAIVNVRIDAFQLNLRD
jgi:hypothetical protein